MAAVMKCLALVYLLFKVCYGSSAKLQNRGSLIYISLNHNRAYYVIRRSSKDIDTCQTGGPKWLCIL